MRSDLNQGYIEVKKSNWPTVTTWLFHLGNMTQFKYNYEQDTLRIVPVRKRSRFAVFCYGVGGLLIIQ